MLGTTAEGTRQQSGALSRRVVLVTGCPRSGTTAVGKVLAMAPHASSIHEPMNCETGDHCITRNFEVPGVAGFEKANLDDLVDRIAGLRLDLKPGVFIGDARWRRLIKHAIGGRTRLSYTRCRIDPFLKTIIWKDPMAALCAHHLLASHDLPIVFTHRPAHAVAASFKRLGWRFDLDDILGRAEAAGLCRKADFLPWNWSEPAVNGAILWRLIHRNTLRLADAYPKRVFFFRIDEILQNPYDAYEKLFSTLQLQFSQGARKTIATLYDRKERLKNAVPPNTVHTQKRDLQSVNRYWRQLLSDKEAELVSEIATA